MALKINSKSKVYSYTAKEIFEDEYPEIWQDATAVVGKLIEYQLKLVNKLTEYKGNLPKSFDELKDLEAQRELSNYIRIRSLYSFAHKLWELIDEKCLDLAQKTNEKDWDNIDVAKSVLQNTLQQAIDFPYEEIAKDNVEGLLRLNELKDKIKERMDFPVFPTWSFRDIIGTITNDGLQYEPLWQSAIDDEVPSDSNIGDLLVDNKMIRIY